MEVKISSQFASDFKMVNDVSLHEKVKNVLRTIKRAQGVDQVPHLRNIKGNNSAYKIGVGFYYLVGVLTSEKEMIFLRFLHRDQVLDTINKSNSQRH
ncbi:hypothetical protein [Aquimarina celericrescens]|uniref:Uncharacterized protein n=1 Tax=Aquimarina celericrescens TaxID=1964542 RepID=A0ABW5AVK5_9FLAO|nr:hypothetical protein [Aquimarina celericrescens]